MENMRSYVHCTVSSQCYGKLHSMFTFSCRKPEELANETHTHKLQPKCVSQPKVNLVILAVSYNLYLNSYRRVVQHFHLRTLHLTVLLWQISSPASNWCHHMQDIIYFQAHVASLIKILTVNLNSWQGFSACSHARQRNITIIKNKKIHVQHSRLCISLHVILSHSHVLPLFCWPKSIWGKRLCNPILLSRQL